MNNTDNISKTCEKCKYARQHYSIYRGKFTKVPSAMHCANGKITRKNFEKHFKDNLPCKRYEPKELQTEETEQSIKRILIKISNDLDNVIQVIGHTSVDD